MQSNKARFKKNKNLKVLRDNESFLSLVAGVVGFVSTVYGSVHALIGDRFLGIVDLIIGILLLTLLLGRKIISFRLRSIFLSFLTMVFLSFVLYYGATGNVGYLWFMVYPSVIFYLMGKIRGSKWVLGSWTILLSMTGFHFAGFIRLPYENLVVIQYNVVFIVMSFLAYFAERDRSEKQKEVEELSTRLSFVISNSPLMVFMLNKEGEFEFIDGLSFEKMSLDEKELMGKSIYDIYKNREDILNPIKKAYEGERVEGLELRMAGLVFQVNIIPMISGGKVRGVMGLMIDASREFEHRKGIEEKLFEVEKLNKLMVGRELKMAEMKKIIKSINEERKKV